VHIYNVVFSSVEGARHETDQLTASSVEVKNWNGAIGLPPLPNVL
jgi:hypothetical protein